jgi:hypothetical protein
VRAHDLLCPVTNNLRQKKLPESVQCLGDNPNGTTAPPPNELAAMLNGRLVDIKAWLYLPFIYYAVHHPPEDRYQVLIQPLVEKGLVCNFSFFENFVNHRHHGTWFFGRCITAAALTVIAVVKCGHIDVPARWSESIAAGLTQIELWDDEAPDIRKSRMVVREILNEMGAWKS